MNRSKKGEKITNWEYKILGNNNKCPNCLVGEVQEGPSGLSKISAPATISLSTNYRCPYCGQGYNLFLLDSIDNIGIDENWINIKYQREKKLKNLENGND